MKRIESFILCIVLITLLFSCTNDSEVSYVDTLQLETGSSEKVALTIGLCGKLNTSRIILPNNWVTDAASVLVYVLEGEDTTDGTQTISETLDYSKLIAGTEKISLAALEWDLTLTAYIANGSNADTDKPVLEASATVDLSAGSQDVDFDMKAVTTTDATGKTDIKVVFYKTDNFSYVKYGLYGNSIPSASIISGVTEQNTSAALCATYNSTTKQYLITYTNTEAPVGSGNYFGAKFYDSNDKLIAAYFDKIVIDGGNTSSKTIILGDIFNKPPINPVNLSVLSKVFNDTDSDGDSDAEELESGDSASTLYYVKFVWDDNSDNEEGFDLVITDTTDEDNPSSFTLDSDSTIPATIVTDSLVSGDLKASSTTCTVALTTGHKYTAKIQAVNSFSLGTEDYRNCSDSTINLFTVKYNLDGGYVKYGADSTDITDVNTIEAYVLPYTYSSSVQSLMNNEDNVPGVGKTDFSFNYWKDSTPAKVDNISAGNTTNIELTAVWLSTLTVSMTLPSYESARDIQLVDSYVEGAVVTTASDDTSVTIDVPVVTSGEGLSNVVFTAYGLDGITAISTANNSGDVGVYTDTTTDTSKATMLWTFASTLTAGTYRVYVTADYEDNNGVSTAITGNVYIKIVR